MNEIIENTDKRGVIFAAAEKLFSDEDFDAVSVRDIAKAANVNVAMISYYFGSKEKLFEELIVTRMQSSQLTIKNIATDEKMSSAEKVLAVVDFYVDRLMNNPHVHKMIDREMSISTRPHLREMLINKISSNKDYIKKMVEEGIAKGEFRADADSELLMLNLFALIRYIVGSSYYSCRMLDQIKEEDLFAPEFRQRIKNYLHDLFKNNLFIKQ
ncbi:MAG: transcriptional regulator, TetR family [Bacteroidetes bacterium]|nr:transcriptional regulator, TetR family [Bacteroidota bacterium]